MRTQPQNPLPRDIAVCGALIAFVIAVLLAVPYATGYSPSRNPLFQQTYHFWNLDEWQHCWLVVPIVGYLVWRKKDELSQLPVQPTLLGIIPLVLGLVCYWAGYRVDNYFIGIISLVITLGGAILWMFGWRWMLALIFPYTFLFFALPLLFLESMLAFRLRLIMSDASVVLLNGVGVHTVQQGTAILSAPNELLGLPRGAAFSVDVADPCSGIRSLFALTMVTALYAYFAIKPLWKQLLLFACAVPLAIAGNMARIMMLTVGTIAVGPEIAIGTLEHPTLFHQVAGYIVFVVALAGMIGIGHLLMLDWPDTLRNLRRRWGNAFDKKNNTNLHPLAAGAHGDSPIEDEY